MMSNRFQGDFAFIYPIPTMFVHSQTCSSAFILILRPKSEVLRHKNDKQLQAASFGKSGSIPWMPSPSSKVVHPARSRKGSGIRPHKPSYTKKIFFWNFYDMQLLPLHIQINSFP
jgi:hypothetical protein